MGLSDQERAAAIREAVDKMKHRILHYKFHLYATNKKDIQPQRDYVATFDFLHDALAHDLKNNTIAMIYEDEKPIPSGGVFDPKKVSMIYADGQWADHDVD